VETKFSPSLDLPYCNKENRKEMLILNEPGFRM
jgi:hypothetical protein